MCTHSYKHIHPIITYPVIYSLRAETHLQIDNNSIIETEKNKRNKERKRERAV
jgi:hypothetical protein